MARVKQHQKQKDGPMPDPSMMKGTMGPQSPSRVQPVGDNMTPVGKPSSRPDMGPGQKAPATLSGAQSGKPASNPNPFAKGKSSPFVPGKSTPKK